VDRLLVAFISFTFILVITPGSTTAVVVRNTIAGGVATGLAAAVGAAVGNTTHATAAALGLALVFARWPTAMTVLRIAGAFFLAALGVLSLYRVARFDDGGIRLVASSVDETRRVEPRTRLMGFQQGLAVNLLNPAIASFYLVVVPTFLPLGATRWYFAGLAAIHVTMALCCHSLWALGLDRLQRVFRPPAARRLLEAATGLALLGLAVRVLLQ